MNFDVHTLLVCGLMCWLGCQCVCFGICARAFAVDSGLLSAAFATRFQTMRFETGLLAGVAIIAAGVALAVAGVVYWARNDFGDISYATGFRIMIPAVTLISVGFQTITTSFFLSFLTDKSR